MMKYEGFVTKVPYLKGHALYQITVGFISLFRLASSHIVTKMIGVSNHLCIIGKMVGGPWDRGP